MALKRRIILLLDGTWNEERVDGSRLETNVVLLKKLIADSILCNRLPFRRLEDVNANERESVYFGGIVDGEHEYLIYYERGVGTGPGFDRLKGGIFGAGLDINVRRAYKFLSRHYRATSEIFIFGFSRGAYTARSLVGFLNSAGLLQCEHCSKRNEQKAWTYYRTSPNDRLPAVWSKLQIHMHPIGELRVACLGLFDTVGALGVPANAFFRWNREKYEFHDVELSPIVKLNLHALAIDERRSQFEASVWRLNQYRAYNSITEQVWFVGDHADIGGGHSTDDKDAKLSDIALDWMIKRLKNYFRDFPIAPLSEAFPRGYPPLEHLPEKPAIHDCRTLRYCYLPRALRTIRNSPPLPKGREKVVGYDPNGLVVGEAIHISAFHMLGRRLPYHKEGWLCRRRFKPYTPTNLLVHLNELSRYYLDSRFLSDMSWLWPDFGLRIVALSGVAVDPSSCKEDKLEVVNVLLQACERLEGCGGFDSSLIEWKKAGQRKLLTGGMQL